MEDEVDDLEIPTAPSSKRPVLPPRVGVSYRPGNLPLDGATSASNPTEGRNLIVGPAISLSGNISSCDRLVIEGTAELTLHDCREIEIAEGGLFKGNALIDQAEVRGRFEGELTVHKRLLIRATGRVCGTITYGEIEIERGGEISGGIQAQK